MRALILSGPTREYLDPVRYLSNASSGKMGKALALSALSNGFLVDFVTGPVDQANLPENVTLHAIESANDMLATAQTLFEQADLIIFVAAVADFRPAHYSDQKLGEKGFSLKMVPNPDIAATLCAKKRPNQTTIGFALQTDDGPAKAQAKLVRKNLNAIVLNYPDTLNADDGSFSLIEPQQMTDWGRLNKTECATRILNFALTQRES